jgi:hypothetical protein
MTGKSEVVLKRAFFIQNCNKAAYKIKVIIIIIIFNHVLDPNGSVRSLSSDKIKVITYISLIMKAA